MSFFDPIPTVINPGMTDDEKLLAAWDGVPTERIADANPYRPGAAAHLKRTDNTLERRSASDAARRRVVQLRGGV